MRLPVWFFNLLSLTNLSQNEDGGSGRRGWNRNTRRLIRGSVHALKRGEKVEAFVRLGEHGVYAGFDLQIKEEVRQGDEDDGFTFLFFPHNGLGISEPTGHIELDFGSSLNDSSITFETKTYHLPIPDYAHNSLFLFPTSLTYETTSPFAKRATNFQTLNLTISLSSLTSLSPATTTATVNSVASPSSLSSDEEETLTLVNSSNLVVQPSVVPRANCRNGFKIELRKPVLPSWEMKVVNSDKNIQVDLLRIIDTLPSQPGGFTFRPPRRSSLFNSQSDVSNNHRHHHRFSTLYRLSSFFSETSPPLESSDLSSDSFQSNAPLSDFDLSFTFQPSNHPHGNLISQNSNFRSKESLTSSRFEAFNLNGYVSKIFSMKIKLQCRVDGMDGKSEEECAVERQRERERMQALGAYNERSKSRSHSRPFTSMTDLKEHEVGRGRQWKHWKDGNMSRTKMHGHQKRYVGLHRILLFMLFVAFPVGMIAYIIFGKESGDEDGEEDEYEARPSWWRLRSNYRIVLRDFEEAADSRSRVQVGGGAEIMVHCDDTSVEDASGEGEVTRKVQEPKGMCVVAMDLIDFNDPPPSYRMIISKNDS